MRQQQPRSPMAFLLPGEMNNHTATRRKLALSLLATLCILLASCNQSAPPPVAAAPQPYRVTTDIHQTMQWILDPAADVIWDSAGTIITAEGSRELTPTTEEGWIAVVHAAAMVTESGNLLMLPGRAMGDDWIEYSQGLVEAGKLALKAAQDRDDKALFDAGGRIYEVCRACHSQYMIEDSAEK